MEQLIFEVKELVDKELNRAAEKFGAVNNSDHESFAVIFEEWQEFQETLNGIQANLDRFWGAVKINDTFDKKTEHLLNTEKFLRNSISELIQVAAMVKKAQNTLTYHAKKEGR